MFFEALIPLAAIVLIFGTPVYWLKRRYDLKQLEAGGGTGLDRKELESLREERKLLQARVENLESIVTDSSYELNQRIARLVEQQSAMSMALPAPAQAELAAAPPMAATATAGGRKATTTATAPTLSDSDRTRARPRRVTPVRAPGDLETGAVISNRYRVERQLGRGGMGAVYLAHDEVLGETVALKVISSAWASEPREMIDRFRREASAARRVSSPNVVRIHDLGEAAGGLLFISMEYLPGQTLEKLLDVRHTLSLDDTRDIIGQICVGLSAAHEAGIVHRDLKPQNVIVGDRNAVKIIDFGLAKTRFLDGMTATGLMLGTPAYMSPEQVKGLEVDARSDIYSLGAVTYHAVTGQPPFTGATPIAIGFAHCADTPRPPRELRPDLPATLDAAITAALAKEPGRRPKSADEFRRALG